MIKKSIIFASQLLALLIVIGIFHIAYLYVRNLPMELNLILLGYTVNFVLAIGIYLLLVNFAERQSKNLGFLFLFGSTLKFVVYFLIFDPLFMNDGSLSKLEFFSFFIPYFTCLILETFALVNLLKEID